MIPSFAFYLPSGGMEVISLHTYTLAKLAHDTLQSLTHYNSSPAVKLYCDTEYRDIRLQGAILSFNLIRSNGEYIGYNEVCMVIFLLIADGDVCH